MIITKSMIEKVSDFSFYGIFDTLLSSLSSSIQFFSGLLNLLESVHSVHCYFPSISSQDLQPIGQQLYKGSYVSLTH